MPPRMGAWQPERLRYGAATKNQLSADGFPQRTQRKRRSAGEGHRCLARRDRGEKRGPTERTWGRRCRLPTVGSNQELVGESACPTFFMTTFSPAIDTNSFQTNDLLEKDARRSVRASLGCKVELILRDKRVPWLYSAPKLRLDMHPRASAYCGCRPDYQ